MPDNERCETCIFWKRYKDDQFYEWGHCRRYPPTLSAGHTLVAISGGYVSEPDDERSTTEFPKLNSDEWCGEHCTEYK